MNSSVPSVFCAAADAAPRPRRGTRTASPTRGKPQSRQTRAMPSAAGHAFESSFSACWKLVSASSYTPAPVVRDADREVVRDRRIGLAARRARPSSPSSVDSIDGRSLDLRLRRLRDVGSGIEWGLRPDAGIVRRLRRVERRAVGWYVRPATGGRRVHAASAGRCAAQPAARQMASARTQALTTASPCSSGCDAASCRAPGRPQRAPDTQSDTFPFRLLLRCRRSQPPGDMPC